MECGFSLIEIGILIDSFGLFISFSFEEWLVFDFVLAFRIFMVLWLFFNKKNEMKNENKSIELSLIINFCL